MKARAARRLGLALVGLSVMALINVPALLSASRPKDLLAVGRDITSTLHGSVVDGSSRGPIGGATVTVGLKSGGTVIATTDASGSFSVPNIGDGTYRATAAAEGYLSGGYGQVSPEHSPRELRITNGKPSPASLIFTLWKPSKITGRVTDNNGAPVRSTDVRLISQPHPATGWHMSVFSAVTDSDGVYTFDRLKPGHYVVGVVCSYQSVPRGVGIQRGSTRDIRTDWALRPLGAKPCPYADKHERTSVSATTFYPSSADLQQADRILLHAGDQRIGIDLTMSPLSTVQIAGVVSGPLGPLPAALVRLTRLGNTGVDIPVRFDHAISTSDHNGHFLILAARGESRRR